MLEDPSQQGWVPASLLERSEEEEVIQPEDPMRPDAASQSRE
jgi:hypothetical protein